MDASKTLSDYLKNFYDKRLLTVFVFGIASGFPWVMIGSAMSAWLKDEGISRSSIGFFGLVFTVYSINFLWSPLVDRIKFPFVTAKLGQRRSWILMMQLGVIGACLALSQINAASEMAYAGLLALIIAISSATQDIVIDAYRIDIIDQDDQEKISAGAGMATSGWWTGFSGLGSIAFFLSDMDGWDWPDVYLLLALIMSLFIIAVLLAKEPESNREKLTGDIEEKYLGILNKLDNSLPMALNKAVVWLVVSLVEPIVDFFRRNGFKLALSLLFFILFFKIGEAFLGRMSIVFYKEVGFSNSEIGFYSKLVGWWVTIVFSLIGSVFTMRFGIVKGLFVGGIAMASSNLMFSVMAMVGPSKTLFMATVLVDGFTMAWSSVAVVAFISMLCSRAFTASQYALLASLSALGRTFIGSSSGVLVDSIGGNWALFFIITTLMVIPGLLVLWYIKDDLHAIEAKYRSDQQQN